MEEDFILAIVTSCALFKFKLQHTNLNGFNNKFQLIQAVLV